MLQVYRWVTLAWLALAGLALATPATAANTTAKLLLSQATARPGEAVWAGVQLRMAPGWHTYWENGGDSGAATKIDWTLPAGVTAGEIQWPTPEKNDAAGLITYVYHNEVVLLVPLSVASNAAAGPLELKAKVSWLECAELCLPASGSVSATLNIGTETKPSAEASIIGAWKKKLPQAKTADFARATWETPPPDATNTDARPLVLDWTPSQPTKEIDFYPFTATNALVRTASETLPADGNKVRLRKGVEKLDSTWPSQIAGLLIEKGDGGTVLAAHQVRVTIETSSPSAAEKKPLLVWLLYAFIGGLILNIMPCVLPVIALKILGFVGQSRENPGRVRTLGAMYTLGVIASFLVLAGIVIGIQAAGQKAGWGLQFSNPQFIVFLTVVVTLVALNLFGLFEVTLSGGAMGAASQAARQHGNAGAFMNGVLATVLATPCTAPFLGAALGFAFAQTSRAVIVLFFITVALGLALPYLLLSWNPKWLKLLPKPGDWMERFKVAMGFPMLGTAVWLFSLTYTFYGERSWWLGVFLVFVGAAAWAYGTFVQRGSLHRGIGFAVVLALLGGGYVWALDSQLRWRSPVANNDSGTALANAPEGYPWQRWSHDAIAKARAEGHPVVVDFTAKWCLTCNISVKPAFETKAVIEKLKVMNAVALLADYTRYPPEITKELELHGRGGVPMVLVYPADPGKAPIVLSEPLPYPAPYAPTILEGLEKVDASK